MKGQDSRIEAARLCLTLKDEGGAARTAPPSGWSGWLSDTIKSDRLAEQPWPSYWGYYSDGQFLQRSPE